MDKVLVTGAAGFIGFSICNKLLEFGIDVCGLDNLNNYYDPRLKSARLEILTKKGMPFSKIDLADAEKVKKVFNSYKPTHVINLAAQAGVRYSLENPHAYINSNILGFLNDFLMYLENEAKRSNLKASTRSLGSKNSVYFKLGLNTKSVIPTWYLYFASFKNLDKFLELSFSFSSNHLCISLISAGISSWELSSQ